MFLPDTRPEFRIPGLELPTFPLAPWGKSAKLLWALVWGKGKGEARRCDSILRQSPGLHVHGTILARRRSRQRRMASPPARWHHAPVHGQPEPFSGEKNSHRTSRRRHKLSPPPKQAGGEIPSDRIGRPVAPHHDVAGLDFPHAILVCWGALGGFCTRVLQAAAPPAWPRAASIRCRHHTLPPRIMTRMAVDWTSPSSCQKKPPHRRRRVLFPKASCAQPAATHFAAVSQASRRPSRTRLVPVRLAEGEIERERCRLSSQRPASQLLFPRLLRDQFLCWCFAAFPSPF